MIQEIINGICLALDAEFNTEAETYQIYTEDEKDSLKPPCFSVFCTGQSQNAQTALRCRHSFQFRIRYHPVASESQEECQAISERLGMCLNLIFAGDVKIRGCEMSGSMENGTFIFQVKYDVFSCLLQEPFRMDRLSANTNVKE